MPAPPRIFSSFVLSCVLGVLLGAGSAHAQRSPLTFEAAVRAAMERNERARAAGERAAAAAARLDRARSFFFPELTVLGNYTYRPYETVRTIGEQAVTFQARNALSATAVARVAVLDARGFPLYRQARLDRDAAQLEAVDERRLVGFEAGDAFLQTLSAEQVRAAAERRLELARRNLADARARFEAGLVSAHDVTRSELEVATAEREATRAGSDLATSYLLLGLLIDLPVQPPLAAPDALLAAAAAPLPAPPSPPSERVDVAAAEARAEALRASAVEPLVRLIPSLELLGQYRVTNEPGLSGRTGDGFVGLELTWALFDGGERYAEARERRALAAAASLTARLRERTASVDVARAQVALEASRASLAQAEVAARVAQRNAQETEELYRQGLADAFELADASVRLFEADVALARERYGLAISFLDYRAAVGVDPLGSEVTP